MSRYLGGAELYSARCHDHYNLNVMVALTIHTRAPLDIGIVQITLQELQHQYPLLTSRISKHASKDMFSPMELPILPLDQELTCTDMLHTKFDTENGPLWRVQIVTRATFEAASSGLGFGPEMEAIIEDDSDVDTRWRYYLRYLQGCLNQDIDNFENSLSLEEEGRSVVIMTFHPSITDTTGAFYLAKQFMLILDKKLENDGPITSGEPEPIPSCVEKLLPSPDSMFHLGDLVPMMNSVVNHFIPTRKSPLETWIRPVTDTFVESERTVKTCPATRSHFLRGWLSEDETRELLAQCEEDDISLHGVLLAACLAATSRVCCQDTCNSNPTVLRASINTNLRQFISSAPKHGNLSVPYEENFTVPMVGDSEDFWKLAHAMTMSHNTAKSNRTAVRQLRLYSKIFSTPGGEATFKDMENSSRITNEMSVSVHGDLGSIFRRESQVSPYESWSGQPLQVKLEDVFPMQAGQNMGSPVHHSGHVYQGRLQYILTYYTTYVDTSAALMLRDETMNILRMAVM